MAAAISTVGITELAVFREYFERHYHIHGPDLYYCLSELAYLASFNQITLKHHSKRFIESLSNGYFLVVTGSVEAVGCTLVSNRCCLFTNVSGVHSLVFLDSFEATCQEVRCRISLPLRNIN